MTTRSVAIAAGIDVGQRFLDVALAPSGKSFRVANLAEGIAAIVEQLRRKGVGRVVLEAIGPYAQRLASALVLAGFEVGLTNPRRIEAFREAEGRRARTDRLDARLMARFALAMRDAIRPLPPAGQLALKALSTRRQRTEMIAMEKTQLKQASEPLLLECHRAAMASLAAQCRHIEPNWPVASPTIPNSPAASPSSPRYPASASASPACCSPNYRDRRHRPQGDR
jgi:transposase